MGLLGHTPLDLVASIIVYEARKIHFENVGRKISVKKSEKFVQKFGETWWNKRGRVGH